ncbi:MAG: hypothetical protein L0241_32310 [Planctomycetia bacterium]|nr:hypothetical protein [Planctomycetia bacterium]
MLVKKLFKRHYEEIRAAIKEDLEGWSEMPDGPFNTDPILEPRLAFLSKNPEGWIEDSETRDGIRTVFVIYVIDATIRCRRYKDNGPDQPLTEEPFVGIVTYEVPVSFEIDVESKQSEFIDINSIAWQKGCHWPN